MKIVVLSDTHGKINLAIDIINWQKPDMVIHLGDLVKDAEDIRCIFSNIKIEYIAGNNDFYSSEHYQKIIDIESKKILLTHGHKERVKYGLEQLKTEAKMFNVDAVLFGHTHVPFEEREGECLYFNPGSTTYPQNKPSYGLLETKSGILYSMICEI